MEVVRVWGGGVVMVFGSDGWVEGGMGERGGGGGGAEWGELAETGRIPWCSRGARRWGKGECGW